ncbi:hypothetical protein [cyanobacterium endosymbiont of Epithemia turgida]|nr:hypothetical protein [cyanobacterium endosymbiont of Epithemia turgida]
MFGWRDFYGSVQQTCNFFLKSLIGMAIIDIRLRAIQLAVRYCLKQK